MRAVERIDGEIIGADFEPNMDDGRIAFVIAVPADTRVWHCNVVIEREPHPDPVEPTETVSP